MTQKTNETKQETMNPAVKPGDMPALKLNMADRFYLAVAKRAVGNLVFIYTIGCTGKGYQYDATASTEIATFDDPHKAEIYYQTILELISYEKKSQFAQLYELMVDFNDGLLKNFCVDKREK